jgi:hypothetical protein
VAAHVGLDYPVGGEIFHEGDTVLIQWHTVVYHGPADWDLFFSKDGGSTWDIITEDLPESQFEYNWMIPDSTTNSGRVKVVQDNASGQDYTATSGNFTIDVSTGIEDFISYADNFALFPAYPNPFNPTTTIEYSIPSDGFVKINIYNAIGEEVRTIVNEFKKAGGHKIIFDGSYLTSGIYFYRIEGINFSATNRMILMK